MAIVAGVSLEKLTTANRSDPAGTGDGGTISDTLPYGYNQLDSEEQDLRGRGYRAFPGIRLDRQTQL